MKKSIRNKILSALVCVALIIIILPFFQRNQEISPDTSIAAAPPFPGQPLITVSTTEPGSTSKIQLKQDDIIQPSASAWVVQIGSYKNKENALRIVNQLRANGYHAFIQEISGTLEETTRVYVGPEPKQTHAQTLADRLKTEMNLTGIVISYKPLII